MTEGGGEVRTWLSDCWLCIIFRFSKSSKLCPSATINKLHGDVVRSLALHSRFLVSWMMNSTRRYIPGLNCANAMAILLCVRRCVLRNRDHHYQYLLFLLKKWALWKLLCSAQPITSTTTNNTTSSPASINRRIYL